MIRFAVFLVVFLLMTPPTKANSASYNDAQTNLIESQIAQLNNNLRANLARGGKKKVVKKCKVTVKKIKKGKKVKLKRIKKCKKVRVKVGGSLPTLVEDSCLKNFARNWANHMADTNTMVHQTLMPILNSCGGRTTGENIAFGYANAGEVNKAWINSSGGHYKNMVNSSYRKIGVGVAKSSNGTLYYSVVFGG